MKRYRFYMLTVMLIFILFSLVTMRVKGQGEVDFAADRELYEQLEDSYTERLKDMLENKGYRNAGISMTKIYQPDGSREYTVQIHHKRINQLSDGEKLLLLNELSAVSFGGENCSVLHKFLNFEV